MIQASKSVRSVQWLAFVVFLGSAACLQAEPQKFRPPHFLQISHPAGTERIPELEKLIHHTFALWLQEADIRGVVLPALSTVDAAGLWVRQGPPETGVLREVARREGADYVLAALYRSDPREVAVAFFFYDVQKDHLSDPVVEEEPVSLAFDRVIASAITKLLMLNRGRIESHFPEAAAGAEGQPVIAASSSAPAAGEQWRAVQAAAGWTTQPGPWTPVPAPDPTTAPPAGPSARPHLELAAGTAALLPIGKAGGYFTAAFMPTVHLRYVFPAAGGRVGLGFSSGLCTFEASGASATADSLLLPAAIEVRYSTEGPSPLALVLHAAAGAAPFSIRSEVMAPLWKTVGYAAGGLGLGLSLGDRLGVTAGISFQAFLESMHPIWGFAPGVSISLKVQ